MFSLLSVARLHRRATARLAVAFLSVLAAGPVSAQAPIPDGVEFQANTFTRGRQSQPAVALDADGDFVVVWTSDSLPAQDGSLSSIHAQRYTADGTPVGGEFRVNTGTVDYQAWPAVAMDDDGDFAVVWASEGQDGSYSGVYAQRYDAAGQAQGPEFAVNTFTEGAQTRPAVAMDADGDFVVAWQSGSDSGPTQDGWGSAVIAHRFSAAGERLGGEIFVNTQTSGNQMNPAVAMSPGGAFAVVWEDEAGTQDIWAQRYSTTGAPLGTNHHVNSVVGGAQVSPSVAMDAAGNYVVAWDSYGTGAPPGISYKLFTAEGTPRGSDSRADLSVPDWETYDAVVAADPAGGFVITWTNSLRTGGINIAVYVRRFSAAGAPQGEPVLVSTSMSDLQQEPTVAVADNGDFVSVWRGIVDTSNDDVFGQRYRSGAVAAEPGARAYLSLALAPSPIGRSGGHVHYTLPTPASVRLAVTDVLGREVAVLASGDEAAGPRRVALPAGRLAPGVYVVRLTAGASVAVRRLTVAR